jgi:hypothetical protein
VLDASQLKRSLYLTFQLMEMGMPVVLGLQHDGYCRSTGPEAGCESCLAETLGLPWWPRWAAKTRARLNCGMPLIAGPKKPESSGRTSRAVIILRGDGSPYQALKKAAGAKRPEPGGPVPLAGGETAGGRRGGLPHPWMKRIPKTDPGCAPWCRT